jgi:hypothetical protein
MRHKAQIRIILLLAVAVIAVLLLSGIGGLKEKDTLYSVTAEQWQEALGDRAYIQTIYRDVTIEINSDFAQEKMVLATANGSLMMNDEEHGSKLICIASADGFVSYIWQDKEQVWEKYDGKADSVDVFLNTYLPRYVDTAMSGLQGEFDKAVYDDAERCYSITLQKESTSEESVSMHCRIFFENGKLIRLETEIVSGQILTVCLYNIGCTVVEAPEEIGTGN